jgi:hypothetical protein
MSTTSRPSKLDMRLRNPTSTQRQWLQDTDLLAVRMLYTLRTPRRDFEGGGGSGAGAMAGQTPTAPIWNSRSRRDGNGNIRIHGDMRATRNCTRNPWSYLPSAGMTQPAPNPRKTAVNFTKNGLHEKQTICSRYSDPTAQAQNTCTSTYQEPDTEAQHMSAPRLHETPLRRVRLFTHGPRAALYLEPHN